MYEIEAEIGAIIFIVSIIQTCRPWTTRRTSGRIVNKKIWRESEAYWNFGKLFDWPLAIKRHIVMATHLGVIATSSVHHLMKSSSRRLDGKSRTLDDRDYYFQNIHNKFAIFVTIWP